MKFKHMLVLAVLVSAGCSSAPVGQAYWQRVEDSSALYLTGPKAQQQLEENIALCVHEIDEMVKLDALRGTLPPDTHSEYNRALKASGDLAYYDTPTQYRDLKVAHSDFHDFESCMRGKGWERVTFMRYQTASKAENTYRETKQFRETGLIGDAAVAKKLEQMQDENNAIYGVNP